MISAYSVNGFINAVLRRGGKTLLVEGVTDRSVILRMCADSANEGVFIIDQAGILEGSDCAGLGNKEKIQEVVRLARSLASRMPRINDSLAVLQDREWDGLAIGERRLSDAWIPPHQGPQVFSTLGHSIENYSFRCDHIVAYLKLTFSDHLKPGIYNVIIEEFPKILAMASCVSLALQEEGLLTRANGLVRHAHIGISKNRVELMSEYGAALEARGCSSVQAERVVSRCNNLVRSYAESLGSSADTRWLPHGHVGEEVIWAAAGACAREAGVDVSVCDSISTFGRKERQRYVATLLSQVDQNEVYPLRELVDWLHT